MLSSGVVVTAALVWLGLLFAGGVRRAPAARVRAPGRRSTPCRWRCTARRGPSRHRHPGRALRLAAAADLRRTIALYALGTGLLVKLVRQVRETNATSLADFIATRLGKDGWLAAVVTLVALVGIVPYIALQLKAVAMSFSLLVREDALQVPAWQDSALYVALAMAAFAMLFGTRSASAAEHNRGLVLAMAFEGVMKLGSMLALGWFVLRLPEAPLATALPPRGANTWSGFAPLVLLGVLAMFTLPHQFHVGAVECRDERHVWGRAAVPAVHAADRAAVLPIARRRRCVAWRARGAVRPVRAGAAAVAGPRDAGAARLPGWPQRRHRMVIVSTLALSLMIGNHLLTPLLLHGAWSSRGRDLRGAVLARSAASASWPSCCWHGATAA